MPKHVLMSDYEIITDGGRRRRWKAPGKLLIVEETLEERTDFLAGSGSYPPEACNLCAIQSEGPESARKQPLTETRRIHPMSRSA